MTSIASSLIPTCWQFGHSTIDSISYLTNYFLLCYIYVMVTRPLTARQEAFCLNFFKSNDAGNSALLAGYSPHFVAENCGKTLKNPRIQARLASLRAQAKATAGDAVMDVAERQIRLSEIARARLVDFIVDGEPKLDKDIPNHVAASEFSVKSRTGKYGDSVEKSIKLRDPIAAIAELNKMEHVYTEQRGGDVTNNLQINIIVKDGETKELLGRLMAGERLDATKSPGKIDGNSDS